MSETRLRELKQKYPEKLQSLVGVDGNAFSILGHFRQEARRAGWDADDIEEILEIAQSDDYNYLMATIIGFTDS